ncbi:MAG: PAS domain S-box protein [Promethearchaeota archaeon]
MEIEDLLNRQDIPEDVTEAIRRTLENFRQMELKLSESEKKYRNALEESEAKNQALLRAIPDLMFQINKEGKFTAYSGSRDELYATPEEFIGKNVHEVLPEKLAEQTMYYIKETLVSSEPQIFEYQLPVKGIKHHYECRMTNLGEDEVLSIVRDVTEFKRVEKEIWKSKEKYQMLVEKLEEGVLLENAEGEISFVNPKTAKLLGYTEEELVGQHWSFIVPKEYLDQITQETSKRPEGIGTTYEASLLAKDGVVIPVIITATPVFSHKGEFDGVLSVFTDIKDRKEVEQKLRESEERYRSYVVNARDIIFSISLNGTITSLNPVMESITGWLPNEWIGKSFLPLIHEEDLPLIEEGIFHIVKLRGFPAIEVRLLKKFGDYVPVEIKASAQIVDGEVKGVLGIARNITKRKQAEEALRKVKLEEERYHAMMSHFINNDMQKIINNLELILLMQESNLEINRTIINKAISIASGSSKTIDMVNHIFEILQTPFIPRVGVKLLDIVENVLSQFSEYSEHIIIDKNNLDTKILVDTHLNDVFNELLAFILKSFDSSTDTSINITGSYLPSFYSVQISDYCSEPLTHEIVSQLSGQITDEWEVIGHHIGIALCSVIMEHYGGNLKIMSSGPKGNVFELRFPKELVETETETIKIKE